MYSNVLIMMGGGSGGAGGLQFVMLIAIFVVMYFFMIRPQQKKAKEQQNFKDTVDKGRKIVTIGGVHGRILEVREKTFVIEVGNGIKMEIEKAAISMENTRSAYPEEKKPETAEKK